MTTTEQPLCWVQREVILTLLSPDHARDWRLVELQQALAPFIPAAELLRQAVDQLAQRGCVDREGRTVRASRPTRTLDRLGLVCI